MLKNNMNVIIYDMYFMNMSNTSRFQDKMEKLSCVVWMLDSNYQDYTFKSNYIVSVVIVIKQF